MSARDGARAVTDELVGDAAAAVDAERAAADGEQVDLFEPPASKALRVGSEAAKTEGEKHRARGRPKGARNRSTKELREWLLAGGILPQQWMASWLLLTPEELAARLSCKVAEAFDRQARLADSLAPYLMAKMAPTDGLGNAVPMVGLFIGGEQVNVSAPGAAPPWARTLTPDVEDYQGLSEGLPALSQDDWSKEGEK